MNRMRNKAFLSGQPGTYSTDTVKGQSDLSRTDGYDGMTDSSFGRYDTSYRGGIDGSVALGKQDYSNPGYIFHNNVGDRVITEQIYDNKLIIDSTFSDHSVNREPFKFTIKFNGYEPKTEDTTVYIDGEPFTYTKYLEGDTCVVMDRVFKNVKIVTINSLIMPHAIDYKTNPDGSYEKVRKLAKTNYKYLVLKINELTNNRTFSNNKAIGKEAFIMKMDDEVCHNNHRWIAVSSNVAYPDAKLQSITRLSVEVCNDSGRLLYPTLDGKPFDFFAEYRKLIDRVEKLQNRCSDKTEEEIQCLLPRLRSLKDITSCISPELHMTFGTFDPQINTLPQFRY